MRKTKIVSTLGPKTRECDQMLSVLIFHMIIMRFMVKQ